ncbi:hypothetical protein PV11_01148 [Exophiala sideris]|uniref:Uncharacterized protein n=1 Tax=Exophiala sideris TaxID=1016849 RepID=A0A0D1W9E8_9EURO|nr:hypothetical protein PV11_01148 [Exophiala sideris]
MALNGLRKVLVLAFFSDGVHFGEEMVLDGDNKENSTGGFMLDSGSGGSSDGHKTMIPRVI